MSDELMRLHAATATPALEQLCWYDVKPEQASFFEACLEEVPKLVAERDAAVRELNAIRGEHTPGEAFTLANPRPSLAGVLAAERDALRREVGACLLRNTELHVERDALKAELKDQREPGCQCTSEIGDSPCPAHPLNPATELPYTSREAGALAAQLTELREAADAYKAAHQGSATEADEAAAHLWTVLAKVPPHG